MPTNILFADWGQPATLLETITYYDPDTGQVEQSEVETPIDVVSGPGRTSLNPETTATREQTTHVFLVRTEALTSDPSLVHSHLKVGEQKFRIINIESSPLSGLTLLHCE